MSHLTDETSTPETAVPSPEAVVPEPVIDELPEAAAETPEANEVAVPEDPAETAAGVSSEPVIDESEPPVAPEAETEAAVESEPEVVMSKAEPEPEAQALVEAEAVVEASSEASEAAEPEAAEPEAAEPVTAEPEAAEPVTAEPVTAEPVSAEPVDTEPEAAEPVTTEPAEAEAAAAAAVEQAPPAPAAEVLTEAAKEARAATVEAAVEAPAAEAAEKANEKAEKPVVLDPAVAELDQAMKENTLVKGQVIGWNKGGYHVAVGKIAAFCPVSQIEIGNPRGPKRYLDKTFSFRVIEIQNGGRRIVLSRAAAIKAEREQRAALVKELLQPGAELEGKVSSLTDFGAFVDLGGGIEGLVHVSEISRQRVEHPKEVLRKGQEVKVTVLKIEKGGQRISLSIKRLEPDPWKGVADRFPAGSQFTGKVLRQADFGLFVEVEPGLEGLVHSSRLGLGMSLEHESLQVGQEVSGWVHEVEARRRRLSLSLREVVGGNPWRGVADRFPVGEVAKGTVERLTNFGVFIQLEPGLTGLLPFSNLGGAAGNPRRQYHAGKEVSVRVLSIDRDKRRISLGTESSKAEGSQQDYREYLKKTKSRSSKPSEGMNAMAAAFAKLKNQQGKEAP